MEKIDLRKELKHLYVPSTKRVEVVEVPSFKFVMVDGTIKPGEAPAKSQVFQDAIGALYSVSFTLKFMSKKRKSNPIDYSVMALEGLWWTESGEFDFGKQEPWRWTLMIMQPQHITEEMFQDALRQLKAKKGDPTLSRLRFEAFHEGLCIQTLHIGPYAKEQSTMERLKAFALENGYDYRGRHHEIYLGDPRRARPERLRTVLRHPIEKSTG